MDKSVDEGRSLELAKQTNSQSRKPFQNAYNAALAEAGSAYVQGFLVLARRPNFPLEHAWLEVGDRIVDPNLPFLKQKIDGLYYFAAQRLTVKQLKSAIEEAKEDYPEDNPLPIYGPPPYEYYGDVMLGGADYLSAFKAAEAKCQELAKSSADRN